MQKTPPSAARIGAMLVFALSCFGLLLFLWLSFGGAVPLKPKGYRVDVAFPEAATLGVEADVRVAGVSVGKVVQKRLDKTDNRTIATLEINRRYAPVSRSAHALLREKTLLGETYVELTPGEGKPYVKENGRLADGRVASATQLDEILSAFDPSTRLAFRSWQQQLAKGINGHGRDLNDAIGTLPGFASDAADVLGVLDSQRRALQLLIRNTGQVFGAISHDQGRLRSLVTSSGRFFQATADQANDLSDAIDIFPTFLDESKRTFARLKTFSLQTDPLIRDLEPVAHDLAPTLRDVHAFAPDLRQTFVDLPPLIRASRTGLPAFSSTLRALEPALGSLGPFLEQLNPILEYLALYQFEVSDFISAGGSAIADTTTSRDPNAVGHYLRQIGPEGAEAAVVWPNRLSTDRGNSYLPPLGLAATPKLADFGIFPNYDCVPSGGEVKTNQDSGGSTEGCYVADHLTLQNKLQGRFPQLAAADYSARK
jgi:phospholipid/cholesterol/gamma-HCH transport system substrate-binding protein